MTEKAQALGAQVDMGLGLAPVAFMSGDGNRLAFRAHRDFTTPLVTLAQADAMVAAERDRLAAHFDDSDYMMYRSEVAAAIRRA